MQGRRGVGRGGQGDHRRGRSRPPHPQGSAAQEGGWPVLGPKVVWKQELHFVIFLLFVARTLKLAIS